jgi:VWFA-related protein
VLLDVVVTQHRQRLVTGLTRSDFTVLEDGKPQAIAFFEAHVPPGELSQPAPAPLAAHLYSNLSDQTPSSINIVLFDMLNTPLMDQPYARREMIRFLKTLPSGRQLSLFELGTTLRMIAGFGTSSDELIAAASKLAPHHSELLDTWEERQQDNNQLALARDGSPNQGFFDLMQDFMNETWAGRDENRASLTIQALGELARSVSSFRGRKNVLWLSEEFPVYFGPNLDVADVRPNAHVRTYTDTVLEMAGVLRSYQISLYPIDVRGLVTGLPGANMGGPPPRDQIQQIETLHIAMDQLAKQTGGRAYYNSNDLSLAMHNSLENGSHYYTIAYAPKAGNWDSRYHHIKIQLARPGLEAEYRNGYFATPLKQLSEEQALADLTSAMQPATPQSTMILLKGRALPPDAQHRKVRIDLVLDGSGLDFTDGTEGRKNATLRFETVAFDKNFKPAANLSHTVQLSLPPEKYQHAVNNGLAVHQEIELPPGSYRLRVGVMDDGSQRIGTLDIPLQTGEVAGK